MKRQRVDYRSLSLSRLREPRFSHLLLLLGWPAYFLGYVLTENLIPPERCHVVHSFLDELIPFTPWFLIFYVFWYFLVGGSLLYYLLYDVPRFRQLQIFIMITQTVALLIYIVFPSRQELRPQTLPEHGVFIGLIRFIYAFDTPTGVCPSLHVAYSLGIGSVWLKDEKAPRPWKAFILFSVVMISLSTAFVKQHSVLDIFAALPLGLLAEILVFGKSWWLPRLRKARQTTE